MSKYGMTNYRLESYQLFFSSTDSDLINAIIGFMKENTRFGSHSKSPFDSINTIKYKQNYEIPLESDLNKMICNAGWEPFAVIGDKDGIGSKIIWFRKEYED